MNSVKYTTFSGSNPELIDKTTINKLNTIVYQENETFISSFYNNFIKPNIILLCLSLMICIVWFMMYKLRNMKLKKKKIKNDTDTINTENISDNIVVDDEINE